MLAVGNDIIDLKEVYPLQKTKDARFLHRVFTDEEINQIINAENPEWLLWLFWAAKETAYKLVSNIELQLPVFSHKSFCADFSNKNLLIRYREHCFVLNYETTEEYIYVYGEYLYNKHVSNRVSKISEEHKALWNKNKYKDKFTAQEFESIQHISAALVRLNLKEYLSDYLKIPKEKIAIIRETKLGKTQPPYLIINQNKAKIKIGFSHHGEFFSWVCGKPV